MMNNNEFSNGQDKETLNFDNFRESWEAYKFNDDMWFGKFLHQITYLTDLNLAQEIVDYFIQRIKTHPDDKPKILMAIDYLGMKNPDIRNLTINTLLEITDDKYDSQVIEVLHGKATQYALANRTEEYISLISRILPRLFEAMQKGDKVSKYWATRSLGSVVAQVPEFRDEIKSQLTDCLDNCQMEDYQYHVLITELVTLSDPTDQYLLNKIYSYLDYLGDDGILNDTVNLAIPQWLGKIGDKRGIKYLDILINNVNNIKKSYAMGAKRRIMARMNEADEL